MKSLIVSAIYFFVVVVCATKGQEGDLSGFYTLGDTHFNGTKVSTEAWKIYTCDVYGPFHPKPEEEGYNLYFTAERKVHVVLFRSKLTEWVWRMWVEKNLEDQDKPTSTESASENGDENWRAADFIEKVLVKEFKNFTEDVNEAVLLGDSDLEMHMPRRRTLVPSQ